MAIPEVFKSVGQSAVHRLTFIQHCNVHENNKTVFSKMRGTLCECDRWICELENLLIKKVFWQFFISISKKCREWRVFIAVLVSRQFAISDLKSRKGESRVNKSYRRFSDSDILEFKELSLHA